MIEPRNKDLEYRLCQYLDGQLSRRERLAFEKRLQANEALRDTLGEYAALDRHLAELADTEIEGVDYDLQRAEIVAAVERKALLAPRRRRLIFRRPLLSALAAAASILIVASAALILFGPAPPPGPPLVQVELTPAAPAPVGAPEIVMHMKPPSFDELPLSADVSPLLDAPRGTVVVSVSPHALSPAVPTESLIVY